MTSFMDYRGASPYDESAYVDSEFATKAKLILMHLTRLAGNAKQVNALLRAEANNATFDKLYGIDDTVEGMLDYPRYAGNASAHNAQTVILVKFYNTFCHAAGNFFGLDTEELTVGDGYLGSSGRPGLTTTATNTLAQSLLHSATSDCADFDSNFWRITRYSSGTYTDVADPDSVFYGNTLYNSTVPSTPIEYAYANFAYAVYALEATARLVRATIKRVPATQGGFGDPDFSISWMFGSWFLQYIQLKPCKICQLRQKLSAIREGTLYQKYVNFITSHYLPHQYDDLHDGYCPSEVFDDCAECKALWDEVGYDDISALVNGELAETGFNSMSHYGGATPATEFADKTRDITVYTNNATIEDDPLYIAEAGLIPMRDTSGNLKHTIGVTLIRKYAARRAMVAWDYTEADNPNAFEAYGGKANYRLSNLRNWLNSTKTGLSGWKTKTHDYDAFWSGGQEGYMSAISTTLRHNIAQATIAYNEQTTAAQITGKVNNIVLSDDWAFIPQVYDFNNQAKGWTNFNMGAGAYVPTDALAEELSWLNDYYATEGLYLRDKYYTDGSTKRYYTRFGINPNFKGDTTDYSTNGIYLTSRTVMNAAADTRDATIANRVAAFLAKAPFDGTGSYSTGAVVPSNYNPTYYCFAVVPFHADQMDGVPREKCNGPRLG